MSRLGSRRPAGDGGVASLELVALLPVVILFIMAVVIQLVIGLATVQATNDAVRQAARARQPGPQRRPGRGRLAARPDDRGVAQHVRPGPRRPDHGAGAEDRPGRPAVDGHADGRDAVRGQFSEGFSGRVATTSTRVGATGTSGASAGDTDQRLVERFKTKLLDEVDLHELGRLDAAPASGRAWSA